MRAKGPGANNSVYTSGGKNFAVLCGINTYGTQMPQQPGVDIKDCADKCAQTTGCVSTSYYQGTCYRKTAKTSEGPYTGVDSVNLLTWSSVWYGLRNGFWDAWIDELLILIYAGKTFQPGGG